MSIWCVGSTGMSSMFEVENSTIFEDFADLKGDLN